MRSRSETSRTGDAGGLGPAVVYQGFVFDLDGTIYLGDELLPGAGRLLAKLRQLDRRIVEEPLHRWLAEAGIRSSDRPEEIDFVIASYDRGQPDAGAIVAAIEACTGASCERNLGRPDPLMLEAATELLGLEPKDCVMAGDRLSTDIRMAIDAGMPSAVVLTGATTAETLLAAPPDARPTWVLDRIDRLLPEPLWPELGWAPEG